MARHRFSLLDLSPSVVWKLWLLAFIGLFAPTLIVTIWPSSDWESVAARSFKKSQSKEKWFEPWIPVETDKFGSAWIRGNSLDEALKLDRRIDNGHLHTGQLQLSEGGLIWRP